MNESNSTSLLTDMYELTMLQATLASGTAHRRSVFELFGRRLPAARRFGVVAGVGRALEAIEAFRFTSEQLDYLRDEKIVNAETIDYLKDFRFRGSISGYAEGDCYFEGSPLMTVEGTFAECVLLETVLLSIYNHDCAVASAASRMTIAAHGRPCLDMGARRTHEGAAISAARAAVIGGFGGTSLLEAGLRYGIHTIGTAAHSFTLVHNSEKDAFDAQIHSLGADTTLLVDTYDIEAGVKLAVEAAREAGGELGAVRLDSGDLVAQAFRVRGQLDAMGATSTKITVTNDLDEYAIAALGAAPVDSYGVGTRLVTGSGIPTAALVYKLVSREGDDGQMHPAAKKSSAKSTVGGKKVTGRAFGESAYASEELIVVGDDVEKSAELLEARGARLLQVPLVTDGQVHREHVGKEALRVAADRHVKSRNELPYQGWRLSEGEPAIPTHWIDSDGNPLVR